MKSRYTSNAFQARVIEIIHEQHVPHDILSGSSHDDSYIQVDRTLQPCYATSTPDNAGPWLYGMNRMRRSELFSVFSVMSATQMETLSAAPV